MRKPLLLGLKRGDGRKGEALGPIGRRGSAGHRLFELSGMALEEYLEKFERRNLSDDPYICDQVVAVLGRAAWRRLGLPEVEFFETIVFRNSEWTLLPHPSGRCRIYNNQRARARAREILRRMADGERA